MSPQTPQPTKDEPVDFSEQADKQSVGIVSEFIAFLAYNKKWWLTPILLALLLVGVLILLSGSAAAPFIYPLF